MSTRAIHAVTAGVVSLFLVAAGTARAWAQRPPRPSVVSARIVVTLGPNGEDAVEATFTVQHTAGLPGGVVEHLLVRRPGAQIGEVAVAGAATGVAEVMPGQGITRYRISVTGDPATYTLRYPVRRAPGVFAVPILAPGIAVAGSDRLVTIETLLPDGQVLAGESFPPIDRREVRDGRQVLVHRIVNVPAVVIAEHGARGRFTASGWVSLVGLLLFAAVLGGWYRHVLIRR